MKNIYERLLRWAVTIAAVLAIAVVTLGTLAIPVVLSMMFSWYWMFLYAGYLLAALYVALYIAANVSSGGQKK